MAVKKILRIGSPLLLRVAEPVINFDTPELKALVQDLYDSMRAADGAGLAAPQIGVNLRVVVFGCKENPRYPGREPVPDTVLVNPQLDFQGHDRVSDWEGCLSVPNMRGWVPRFAHLTYRGFTPSGELIQRQVSGFHARVVQHECDHLDGILFPQRIEDLTRFGFTDELFADEVSADS